jgi:capsular exopolysaccharide synthesis family protein
MPPPRLASVLRRRGLRGLSAGSLVLAAGLGAAESWPRPARAAATVEVFAVPLPDAASLGLPAASPPDPAAAALSDPVVELAVLAMGEAHWPGVASGKDSIELSAWEAAEGAAPRRRKATVDRAKLDAAIAEARERLSAAPAATAGRVTIAATDRKAGRARALAERTAAAYVDFAAFDARERLERAAAALATRQAATFRRLMEARERIAKARPDVMPGEVMELRRPDLSASMTRLAELESRLAAVEAEHRDMSAKINDPNFTFVVDVDQDPSVLACMSEVLRAQARLGELEPRFGANDPQVKAAKSDVEAWGTQLKAARSAAVATLSAKERVKAIDRVRTLSEQRDSLKTEFEALDRKVAQERADWEKLVRERAAAQAAAASPEMAALEAEAEVQLHLFTRILTSRLSAEDAAAAAAPGARLDGPVRDVPAPALPRSATWPSAAGAAILAGAVAFLFPRHPAAGVTGKIRTEHDLSTALKVPILGCTPRAPQSELILHHIDARHPNAEAYNTVAALVESYAADHAARTFMITSAVEGDGKSVFAANLGIALARGGQRVLLVDANLRRGTLHEIFGAANDRGVSEAGWDESGQPVIVEVDALLKDTTEAALRLIPSGPPPPNPVALLKGSAFKALLAESQQKADTILLDVPAVLGAVDPLLLTSMVDGIIFVAAAGESKREDVVYAKKLLENTHGRFAGGVLTKAAEGAREIPAWEVEEKAKPPSI